MLGLGGTDLFVCALKSGQKKIFKVNDTEYERMSQHIGVLPVVVIAPGDVEMAIGGRESRRRFWIPLFPSMTNSICII